MDKEIRNPQGEKLDYACHEGIGASSQAIVVIGHGVTANKDREFVVALAAGLAAAGISALRFSFSGNGDSEGRFEDSCPSKEVQDLKTIIDALDGRKVIYVGHSMGGAVGVMSTPHEPRIEGLVSLAGMVDTARFAKVEFGDVTPGAGTMWGKPECPLSQVLIDDMNNIGSVLKFAPHVKVPWLLVHGEADDVVPIEESREIFERANEPRELFEIPRCDHVFDAETDPDALPAMVSKVSEWVIPKVL